MSAYTPGTRVVCVDDPPVIGPVDEVYGNGDLLIFSGPTAIRVGAASVRPAMPRDRADLERWGRWWWRGDRPVLVERRDDGWMVWRDEPKRSWPVVAPSCDWRGPVAPPPEVRS